jgi:cytidylate kinase
MNALLDRCLSFIESQMRPEKSDGLKGEAGKCAITVSRQSGCGAHVFAEKLMEILQVQRAQNGHPWVIFDRELVEAVLRDHGLPSRLARFMPEDRVSRLNDIIEDIFSLHPPTEILVRQTAETVLRLADFGNVIILGRGASVITAKLPHVLSVRLVAPLERRVAHMLQFDQLERNDAIERIKHEDDGRRRYLKKYFGKDIDDPLLYDVVVNTESISLDDAAWMIGHLAATHRKAF